MAGERKPVQSASGKKPHIRRVQKYEKIFDRLNESFEYDGAEADLENLEKYYTSRRWKEDFADDEAGLFPADLKRGVLSEDGVYNLLERYSERT